MAGRRTRGHARAIVSRAIVFLLLGAVVNVAVAWSFAARRAAILIERRQQGCFVIWGRPWQVVQHQGPGMIDIWWYDLGHDTPGSEAAEALVSFNNNRIMQRRMSGVAMPSGRSVELLSRQPDWGTFQDEPLSDDIIMGGDIAFGWPFVCLWMGMTCDVVRSTTANERLFGGWLVQGLIAARGNNFVALPYRMIWPGFTINALFYAAILWLAFAGPFALRRKVRIKRGQCQACAYPIGVSPVCTECGKPVTPQNAVTADEKEKDQEYE